MIKKKQTITLASLIVSVGMIAAMAFGVGARPAYAFSCSILPQKLCDSAQSGTSNTAEASIMQFLKLVLKILTAGIGILAVAALVYAGILYSSAGGNASQTATAKTIITNTAIGIVSYGAMVLFINFLVPGGVFG